MKDAPSFPASIDVGKNSHKSHEASYICAAGEKLPRIVQELYEDQSSFRTDSPMSEGGSRNLVAAFAAIHRCAIHSADVRSAYFQAQPLDRVVMMKQPRRSARSRQQSINAGESARIFGLCGSGRGFWKRLDGGAKKKQDSLHPKFSQRVLQHQDPETGVLKMTASRSS